MNTCSKHASPVIGSIVLASFCLLCANVASAADAETGVQELQSVMSKRATTVQISTGMLKSLNEGNKAVAGNIGSGGAGQQPAGVPSGAAAWSTAAQKSAPGSVAGSESRPFATRPQPPAASLDPQRAAAQRGLASLNPQPLPPVERDRLPGAKRGEKVLPNGIIIVGGKQAGGR